MDQWWREARCLGEDPEAFYSTGHPPPRVVAWCRACPVRTQCLDDALTTEAATGGRRYGYRGGMSSNERAATRWAR